MEEHYCQHCSTIYTTSTTELNEWYEIDGFCSLECLAQATVEAEAQGILD